MEDIFNVMECGLGVRWYMEWHYFWNVNCVKIILDNILIRISWQTQGLRYYNVYNIFWWALFVVHNICFGQIIQRPCAPYPGISLEVKDKWYNVLTVNINCLLTTHRELWGFKKGACEAGWRIGLQLYGQGENVFFTDHIEVNVANSRKW